jgi:mannose-1-phosphate guanylyltransferase
MRALLLAAGLGTRLRPITDTVPKCLVPIHGKPLLEYWLDALCGSAFFDQVLINTHYLSTAVENFISVSPWRASVKLVHEEKLLGTGGTVLENRDFFSEEPFLVAHADNLTRFNVRAFLDAHSHRQPNSELTMMTFDTDFPETCGIVEQDKNGVVYAFHEKSLSPPGKRANAAVYIFEPTVIDFLASFNKKVIDLSTEVIPKFLGRIQSYHNADYHRDIGNIKSLLLAEKEWLPLS